jgi:large subunit ribosomal protein L29
MKYSEIKSLSRDQLEKKIIDLKKELYNIGVSRANGEFKNHSIIKQLKKTIARVLTFMNSKEKAK